MQKRPGRPGPSDELVALVKQKYDNSPKTSTRNTALSLGTSHMSVHRIVRKRLHRYPYKIQLLHPLKPEDKPKRMDWAVEMLDCIDNDSEFLRNWVFSDECTFHENGTVNRHNNVYWSDGNPGYVVQKNLGRKSVNVWCALAHDRVMGIHIFHGENVNGGNY